MPRKIKRNITRNIEEMKKTANYKRTSSSGQELALQETSNLEYIKGNNIQDVINFTDFDVSANKLSIEDRPALFRMTNLIKQHVIKRIVAYKRDRIARNIYEYRYLAELFQKYEVEVIFTSEKEPPFADDLFIETWYGLVAQFEGRNIDSRTNEARKIYPSSLIGYERIVIEDSENQSKKRVFKAVDGLKVELYNLFLDVSMSENLQDLFNVITKYESLLKRDSDRILGILRTPFFAAHYSKDNEFRPLSHVDAIISIDLFKKVQDVLDNFEKKLYQANAIKVQELFNTPICETCKTEMKFKRGSIGQKGSYICSKHKKNLIEIDELDHFVNKALENFLNNIDPEKLEKTLKKSINQKMHCYNKNIDDAIYKLENLCLDTSKQFKINEQSDRLLKQQSKICSIRDNISELKDNVRRLTELKEEVATIVTHGKNEFGKIGPIDKETLAQLIIYKIEVHQKMVHFHLYFNEFLKERSENVAT